MYGAYLVMLSGGKVTSVYEKSYPRVGASYQSTSCEPHLQWPLGGRYFWPHFLHLVPISLPSFNASMNLTIRSVSGSQDVYPNFTSLSPRIDVYEAVLSSFAYVVGQSNLGSAHLPLFSFASQLLSDFNSHGYACGA